MKNLGLLLPTLTDADAAVWATVTALSPLRIKLDGESTALPFTPDSLVGLLAVNDRVRVALSTNDDPAFRGRRVVVLGRVGGVPTGTTATTVALGNHTHPADAGFVNYTETTGGAVNSSSTTEVLVGSMTWTAVTGYKYRYTAQGAWFGGAVGADQIAFRVRYASGASVANTDTQAGGDTAYDIPALKYLPLNLSRWTPSNLSGQYTIGLFIRRTAGTAAVSVERVSSNVFAQELTAHVPL